jgi:hypothetical protein
MSADHLSLLERLAVVRACLDQARASERTRRSPGMVLVGGREWRALVAAIEPPAARCVCEIRIPKGDAQGKTLAEVADSPDGLFWLAWAIRRPEDFWPSWFWDALRHFVRSHLQEAA